MNLGARLKESCDDFAMKNIGALVQEDEFKNLELEYVRHLLTSSQVYSVDMKIAVAITWIKCDVEQRRLHLLSLIEDVDSTKLSKNYVKYLIMNEPICYESAEVLRALHMVTLTEMEVDQPDIPYYGENNAIILFDGIEESLIVFWPSMNRYYALKGFHEYMNDCSGLASAIHGKFLYVFISSKKALKLNINKPEDEWEEIPDMLLDHGKFLCAAENRQSLYVAGSNSIERYNIAKNEWEIIESEGININKCALVAAGKFIYIIGGTTDGNPAIGTCKAYSIDTDSWVNQPSCHARLLAGATAVNERIYLAGGEALETSYSRRNTFHHLEEASSMESYLWQKNSPGSVSSGGYIYNAWQSSTEMTIKRSPMALLRVDGGLIAISLRNDTTSIGVFNFKTNKWTDSTSKISAHAAVALWMPPPL